MMKDCEINNKITKSTMVPLGLVVVIIGFVGWLIWEAAIVFANVNNTLASLTEQNKEQSKQVKANTQLINFVLDEVQKLKNNSNTLQRN